MMPDRRIGHGPAESFRAPLLIALSTVAGLVLGLVGDGGWDMLAAIALAAPVVTYLAYDRAKR